MHFASTHALFLRPNRLDQAVTTVTPCVFEVNETHMLNNRCFPVVVNVQWEERLGPASLLP
jgi:hypothetical protein